MKKTDFTQKNEAELTDYLREKREELRTARFARVGAKAADSSVAKKARAEIARAMTEQGARNRASQAASVTESGE